MEKSRVLEGLEYLKSYAATQHWPYDVRILLDAAIKYVSVPIAAAQGIDLVAEALRDKLYSSKPHGQGDYERGRVAGLQHAADYLRTMIDASSKGGSDAVVSSE